MHQYGEHLEAYPECGLGLSKMARQLVYENSNIPLIWKRMFLHLVHQE
jgi:hypothetical protein